MAINLSPRDFDNIFREQEENENELARIELDQARQELQREKNELARARNDIARRRIELAERELREKEARQERRAATAGTAAENGQFRADYVIRD